MFSLTAVGLCCANLASPVRALAAGGGSAELQPAAGQFFPVAPAKVADTRDGTGGVPAQPLASGGTITFTVTGVGQVPATGVSDVYVLINAIGPQDSGCLNDYDADDPNPDICTVSFEPGQNMSDSDIVQVSPSGQVSVTNESGGTTNVAVSVMGYFQDFTAPATGQTYVPLPQAQIVDTRSGLGAPQAQVPAGGSLTIQVTGNGGVPSDAAGAALFIGAANATATGWVSAYPAGGTASSLAILSYQPNQKARDLYFGALSSSGQLTLVNQGSAPVDLMVGVQGYLVSPAAAEAGGTYQDVTEARMVDTRDGTGGVPATPVAAGGSITFTVTGADDVPATGVLSVAESVAAIGPTASGYLSVYPAGGTDPDNPGVNFTAGDYQDNDIAAPLSSSGQQTITNHSSGTVNVVVSVRGYYVTPIAPSAPGSVTASVSGSSATVTWSPPGSDGGAAITGYTVTAAPDNESVTVSGTATQATLTGLANAAADAFTVTAANAAGTSESGTWAPAGVISGTVLSPDGQPVSGAMVAIEPSDAPASDPATWTSSIIGTATTDAKGIWTFTVPPYSALPADAQAAANNNGGWLNLDASAFASANVTTASGTVSYPLGADAGRSAYVGTSASPSGPVQVASPSGGVPAMIVTPDQADISSQDTEANEEATWGYQNNPTLTDANGNIIGNEMNADVSFPADSYGYQNIAGPDDDGYSPYIAADGTDLSGVSATALSTDSAPAQYNCGQLYAMGYNLVPVSTVVWTKWRYTIVGEFHSNWDTSAVFVYEQDSSSGIGVGFSADGEHFSLDGMVTFTLTQSGEDDLGGGAYTAHHVSVALNYQKIEIETVAEPISGIGGNIVCHRRWKIQEDGLYNPPGATQPYIQVDCHRLANGQCDPNDNTLWASDDGWVGYEDDLPRSYKYRDPFEAGSEAHCDSSGVGYKYQTAATIGNFSIDAETDHATITMQCIDFGSQSRNDAITGSTDSYHWLWGSDATIPDNPKIFYSY